MFIAKSSRRTAVATVLLVAASLTACATSRTAPANAETPAQTVAVTTTPTASPSPTVTATPKVEQYVVISASMSNRTYTDATLHPYRIQSGDTYESGENGRIASRGNGQFAPVAGESHTRYDVTVTYTLRGVDGEIITKTVPRDKVRVVTVDSDYTLAYGTKEQVANGEVTFEVPLNAVSNKDGNAVNLREVAG
jgi:hypothetical protein